jgi:hypothetical protein
MKSARAENFRSHKAVMHLMNTSLTTASAAPSLLAAALALILALEPAAGVAIGLAILVACPPAPLRSSGDQSGLKVYCHLNAESNLFVMGD